MTIRVLVIGRQGQLARSLEERARRNADIEVICVGRPQVCFERVETIEQTISKITPDAVINAAAYTAVDAAEGEQDLAMQINCEAPSALARVARKAGAKLVHISTDYVFDGTKTTPYVETDATNPQNIYGRTKLAGEFGVLAEAPDAVLLRTAWVYSPFGRNFVKTMLDLANSREQIAVTSDQLGNPTLALDLADAILGMVDHWRRDPGTGAGECFHCAGAGEASWYDLARHALETSRAYGGPFAELIAITSEQWPAKARRPKNSRLDSSKFKKHFSLTLPEWRRSVEITVRRLLAEQKPATTTSRP
jgi:dTDP-4-dehydrorhamnose reductase